MENENGVRITITDESGDKERTNFHVEGDPIKIMGALEAAIVYYIKNFSCEAQNDDTVRILRVNLALQCIKNIAKLMLEEDEQ